MVKKAEQYEFTVTPHMVRCPEKAFGEAFDYVRRQIGLLAEHHIGYFVYAYTNKPGLHLETTSEHNQRIASDIANKVVRPPFLVSIIYPSGKRKDVANFFTLGEAQRYVKHMLNFTPINVTWELSTTTGRVVRVSPRDKRHISLDVK